MDYILQIFELIFAPTAIIAGLVYILQKYFDRLLGRDLERFKKDLEAQLQASKMQMEHNFQKSLFEYQTKFSLYHQNRAEFIKDIYTQIVELSEFISSMIGTIYYDDYMVDELKEKKKFQQDKTAWEMSRDLELFFMKNRIYLDEDLVNQVRTVLFALNGALYKFGTALYQVSDYPPDVTKLDAETLRIWEEAAKDMDSLVPELKRNLEREFRNSLTSAINTTEERLENV